MLVPLQNSVLKLYMVTELWKICYISWPSALVLRIQNMVAALSLQLAFSLGDT